MRTTPSKPPRRRPSFRVRPWMIAILVAIVVVYVGLRLFAETWTEFLWYDALGFASTWGELILARWVPAAVFTVTFFVVLFASLVIADRLAPKARTMGAEDEAIARYHAFVGGWHKRIRFLVAAFFALVLGVGVSSQWKEWILFTNAQDFGIKDPEFHLDVGFYVFKLPFLQFIVDWAFAGLIIVLVLTAVAHYMNGGIRFQEPYARVTPQVKAHLSVILFLIALVKTADYWLARYELNFSTRGVVAGAGATDVRAQLPALNLLIVISIAAAILFLVNIRRRGFALPAIAVGLWAFVALVVGTIYPALYQQFEVKPNELTAEKPYIARNIQATRDAFNLSEVKVKGFNYQADLDAQVLADNTQTIDNARVWDPAAIQSSFQALQKLQTFYQFQNADVDRYTIDGKTKQVLIAARELNRADLPSQTWVNRNLVYTHGYGLVASPTNSADRDGNPNYFLENIPPTGKIKLTEPALYYGDGLDGYAIVDTKAREFNYASQGRDHFEDYRGEGGVKLDSVFKRAAFAMKFADFNLLISDQITDKSRILLNRDITARAKAIAPFLSYDKDPYPVAVNGKTYWILDAYTSTDQYPYSQTPRDQEYNYIRNSVKVVLDAYNGTMRFYVMDPKDPIVKAYESAFPSLFTKLEKMPKAMREHLRYPEDIFTVQTEMYGRYHVTDPQVFYNDSNKWEVAPNPDFEPSAPDTSSNDNSSNQPQAASSNSERIEPYYLLIKLPEQKTEDFLVLRPFVPVSNNNTLNNLVSFMVAKSDPDDYGKLESYVMPSGENIFGPSQASSAINKNTAISSQMTLLGRQGSTIASGSMQLIPIGNSIVYVRPIYIENTQGQKYPALSFVTLFYDGKAVFGNTVNDALVKLGLTGAPPETSTPNETPNPKEETPTNPNEVATVQSLLDKATKTYDAATAALKAGDLGAYQDGVKQAQAYVDQAIALLNQASGVTSGSSSTSSTSSTTSSTTTKPASTAQL